MIHWDDHWINVLIGKLSRKSGHVGLNAVESAYYGRFGSLAIFDKNNRLITLRIQSMKNSIYFYRYKLSNSIYYEQLRYLYACEKRNSYTFIHL